MNENVFVIMPAYNAGKKIESVYEKIKPDVLKQVTHFIIIDDGAADDTREKALKIKEKYKKVTIAVHPQNRGYGAAQKTGFTAALKMDADVCILLHADGQCDPDLLPSLIRPIKDGTADMVLGSRMITINPFKTAMPFYKYVGNKTLTFLENKMLKSHISEFHTGYIAYSRKALETIPYEKLDDRFHFDGNMIIMALINNLRITEVPVPVIYEDEKSNLGAFSYAWDVLKTIWRYKKGEFHKLKKD